ncbi:MAG: DUF6340 family protein [Paludibacteraceae bacterium]
MKIDNLKYLYPIFLLFTLSSCSTPRMFTTLDVLRPAEVTFAPQVEDVLIVNNTVVQPQNIGHYNYNDYNSRTPSIISLKFDSAGIFCAAGLRENLEAKDFFNSVSMSQTNMNNTNNFYKLNPLTKQTVRFLCDLYKVDAVISLDHIQLTDRLTKFNDENLSSLDIKVDTKWTIHYPNDSAGKFKEFSDDFSWEEDNITKLPNRYDALVDACILTGSNISDRMIPRWEKQDRYFYTPNKPLFVQAMDSVTYRNWPAAIELWEKASNTTKNYNTKFQASNNIAIAYEILGNLDKAMLYASKAIEYYPYITVISSDSQDNIYNVLDYYSALKKRKEEIKLLDNQLGN